jgi:hypothetical protein
VIHAFEQFGLVLEQSRIDDGNRCLIGEGLRQPYVVPIEALAEATADAQDPDDPLVHDQRHR